MAQKEMTLTSVKVKSDLFEDFKIECVKRKFSFQKLADRSLYLYLTDEDFRKKINSQVNIELNK
jgi:hypothetical protein|tara:strand:- start:44 stop:235 length:192 start_codon:yes stop_codon:yes gene_type:complete